jgi:predicted dehydrogenase
MNLDKIKLGIVGIGRIGINHARIATTLNNTELVGFCDTSKEKADNAAEKYGARAFYDYRDIVKFVDAVIISVQTEFHYEISKYFIKHKKHVLVEKPITINIEHGEELIILAKENKVILSVGHVERFNAVVETLSGIIDKDKVLAISVKRMSPMDYRVKDIDVVLDLMIHDIDIILDLMKPYDVKNIMAMKNIVKLESKEKNHADYCIAQMEFENGTIVDLTASRVTDKKIRKLLVNELNRFIEVDYLSKNLTIYKNFTAELKESSIGNKKTKYQEESIVQKVFVNNTDSLYEEQQNFVNSILGINKLKITGYDGIKNLKIAKEIQKKIYQNKLC